MREMLSEVKADESCFGSLAFNAARQRGEEIAPRVPPAVTIFQL